MPGRGDLLICIACGTQFDVSGDRPLQACNICDDPRQFVPPTGQQWTSLLRMRATHTNKIQPVGDENGEEHMHSIWTEPKSGIGQRCILIRTPRGNVLWDCITYLDEETIKFIKGEGGLTAIVISHPHYYSTHLDWAEVFDCPVYLAAEDQEWLSQVDDHRRRRFIKTETEEIVEGVTAVKVGGHFPGSLVLHWENKLMIADSLVTVPSALYHVDRPPGTTSFAFMWSIPNMIPLPPDELHKIWLALKGWQFESTHGAFVGQEVRDKKVKGRVLESMKIQVRGEGWREHALLGEKWK